MKAAQARLQRAKERHERQVKLAKDATHRRNHKKLKRQYVETPQGRPMVYPWPEWLRAGQEITLVKGKHFTCQGHGLAQQFRRRAAAVGLKVSISVTDEALIVSLFKG